MIPIHLDPAVLTIGLIGDGLLAQRRHEWLGLRGCKPFIWAEPPEDADLARLNILWIADLPPVQSAALASRARALKVIVNVEDDLPFCDFHTPAIVQRGQLTISVGTAGASPAGAGYVRRILEKAIPQSWAQIFTDLSALRQTMRGAGATPKEVIEAAKVHLAGIDVVQTIAPCGRAQCVLLDE